ncbi:MAG TPA: TonB-dependent receptor [Burkholderiaceae bacterium]
MKIKHTALRAALLAAWATGAHAKTLDSITVRSGRPTTLPAQIPTTIEGISGKDIAEKINATDSEDALKYLPSLLVRKRYIGDYNHAVLSTRVSGTGNSARSMVYADGILLSNYLGNGASFAPRWGMVAPEEIERVDVLYGPFSAAYAGNSAGAVVDYVTKMPEHFEVHLRAGYTTQHFTLYSTDERDSARHTSAALGDRIGALSWHLHLSRLDSTGQPMTIATRMLSEGLAPAAGTAAVSGAIAGANNRNQDWWILGTHTRYHTVQDQAKLKLAWDFTPTLRASYTIGVWDNDTSGGAESYLRDAQGRAIYGGNVVIAGRQYNLNASSLAFTPTRNTLRHTMQGATLKSNTRGAFDFELTASSVDYGRDLLRTPTAANVYALPNGAGRLTDMEGTGWHTLNARATWRLAGSHLVEFGAQHDRYRLRSLVSNTADWQNGAAGARFSSFAGNTSLSALYAQDTWRFAPEWKSTLGLRYESWHAYGGELGNAQRVVAFGSERREHALSPKAALAWQELEDWSIKASLGRAWRIPTASELYQGSISGDSVINTDPGLLPERSWTGELSAEGNLGASTMRGTLFYETARDALYSQPLSATVNTVQNIEAVRSSGVELAWQASVSAQFDVQASATYTDSIVTANRAYPVSVGKRQPRIPQWRAAMLATYRPDARWAFTFGARYSGKQYGQLDNSDTHGDSYLGFSPFFVADVRAVLRLGQGWSAAFGIDNLNRKTYWAFHPYTQRTMSAELKWDL